MQVTFGLRLDERQGPSDLAKFMEPVVGRLGFLDLLETYLGLGRPAATAAKRVAAYLGHLHKYDNGKRFYSKSFSIDDVGVAAQLLAWRDEWRLSGWNGKSATDSPVRIQDMACVEELAVGHVAPCEGERLFEVAEALKSGRKVPFTSVVLVDPANAFPWAWRQVIALLPNVVEALPLPSGSGALGELQRMSLAALTAGGPSSASLDVGDGLQVLQGLTGETAEHWLSAWSRANPADRLVLCEKDGASLDATFLATGFPACGFNSASDLRPALQALGLALEMCWAPVHVERLVEFLSHPFGPFSRRARGRLARAFSDQPGLGGDAWARAKTDIGGWEGGPAMLDEVAYWLEGERWSRKDGTPLDALIGRTEKVRGALQRRATGKDANAAAAVSAALHQCTAVLEGLAEFKRQGVPALTPRQVEQLLATSTPGGAGNPAAVAQMGCLKSATTPDTCIEAADEVLWWMPSTPALPTPLPWSTEEVAALKVLGVELRDPRQELELLAMQWLRPLLAARKKFVIVLPPPGAEEHPLCQLIKRLAPGIKVERIDEAIYGAHQDVISHTVEDVLLKPAERYIELGRPIAPRRAEQSYSSLELLFKNPAVAAVNNVAALESSASLWASRENTLLGNLAHRVVELLFQQQGALAWSDSQTLAWFDGMVDGLLAAEGINLLMQGAGVTEARFKRVCGSAICALLHHLQSAKAVRVETEVHFKGMLGTVELGGRIDLLVHFADKGIAALDLKWTRGKRFAEVLSEGKYLQLALYSHLTEQKHGIKPAALGYFVCDRGDLFVNAPDVFPTAQVRSPRNGVTTHELLEQAKASWSWRMGQWKAGTIEFVPYLDDLQEYQGDEGTLPVEKLGPFYVEEFTLLGGWEP